MEKLDEFAKNLQEQIFEKAKKIYGNKGFQRWINPLYQGQLPDADTFSRVVGKCGDTMEVYLKIDNNIVKKASYVTDGCASSNICGSFAAELTLGKSTNEIFEITAKDIITAIGKLPEEDYHCANLAAAAIHEALKNYTHEECSL